MPSHHLPLLLAAFQYRFHQNLQAMSRDLVDDVAIGWDELGTDLLDGAPPALVAVLTGGEKWPSRTLGHLVTPDGSAPVRMTVTDDTAAAQDLQWGYILHAQGIEVISLLHQDCGPFVDWRTDPRTAFSDDPARWSSTAPPPVIRPLRAPAPQATTGTAAPVSGVPARTAAHR
ncbi:hypothetical protein LKL35_09020 [Streptomyces sp. ET3-23]|uniref:hypothetical protein n=1 Tax=Streptomyces sp. ET3-23 TaxID=2885643 RepID=UPI001D10C2D7|nr:hypothetical protein [Streptomyces sp. ET3-23]MCC2275562.1 hypothetical protein [Streptomyces sp. ET3-23]